MKYFSTTKTKAFAILATLFIAIAIIGSISLMQKSDEIQLDSNGNPIVSETQRKKMRTQMRQRMSKAANEYYELSNEDKLVFLEKISSEMENMRKSFRPPRSENQPQQSQERKGRGDPSRRREMSEEVDPETRIKIKALMRDMRSFNSKK